MNFIAPGTHRTERALQKEKTLPEGTTRGPRTVAGRVRTLLLLAACASMLGGCAVGSGEVRDLSTEKAARLIIDGRTTMAQIDAELGEPDYGKLFKNPCSQAELNKIVPFGFSLQHQKMVFFCHQNSIILLC